MCTKENCCSEPGVSKREPGYYWIMYDETWEVAFWDGEGWLTNYYDADFAEIDERRIERQPIEKCVCNTDSELQPFLSEIIDVMIYSGVFVETNKLKSLRNELRKLIESQKK